MSKFIKACECPRCGTAMTAALISALAMSKTSSRNFSGQTNVLSVILN